MIVDFQKELFNSWYIILIVSIFCAFACHQCQRSRNALVEHSMDIHDRSIEPVLPDCVVRTASGHRSDKIEKQTSI